MKKISKVLKKDWIILIIIILGFGFGAYFYSSLPDRVPIHWNIEGEVNGYGTKFFGAFGLPLINLGCYLMFIILPYIDPKKKNYEKFNSTYQYLKYILIIFLFGIQVITLLASTGVVINIADYIQIMISLIFILIGNVMGRFSHNYFVGIKTPWTLADEQVWKRTHRIAGPLWVIGGILNLLLTFTGIYFKKIGFIIILIIIVVIPIIYSYILYRKIHPNMN